MLKYFIPLRFEGYFSRDIIIGWQTFFFQQFKDVPLLFDQFFFSVEWSAVFGFMFPYMNPCLFAICVFIYSSYLLFIINYKMLMCGFFLFCFFSPTLLLGIQAEVFQPFWESPHLAGLPTFTLTCSLFTSIWEFITYQQLTTRNNFVPQETFDNVQAYF